jgi:hypothetical protein
MAGAGGDVLRIPLNKSTLEALFNIIIHTPTTALFTSSQCIDNDDDGLHYSLHTCACVQVVVKNLSIPQHPHETISIPES